MKPIVHHNQPHGYLPTPYDIPAQKTVEITLFKPPAGETHLTFIITRTEKVPRPGLRAWWARLLGDTGRTGYYWRLYTEDGRVLVYKP